MAAETPQTWAERVPVFDGGDPISGREATIIGADAMNTWRAIVLGLAQSHGLPADATHEDLMEAFKQGHALTGEIKTYAGPNAPAGWLLCNGVLLRITDHPALFGVLAHSYAADGDTTDSTASEFRLPDLRGRTPIGAGQGEGLTARVLGAKAGDEDTQEHQHLLLNPQEVLDGGYRVPTSTTYVAQFLRHSNSFTYHLSQSRNNAAANVGLSSAAGDGQNGNMQPWVALNYIIKT